MSTWHRSKGDSSLGLSPLSQNACGKWSFSMFSSGFQAPKNFMSSWWWQPKASLIFWRCHQHTAVGSYGKKRFLRQCHRNNWRFFTTWSLSRGQKLQYARWLQNGVVNFTFEWSFKKGNKHRKNGSHNINKNNGPASQRCSSMTNWH